MRYLIAGFVTEYEPIFENLRELSKPFEYSGDRETQIKLSVSPERIEATDKKMRDPDLGRTENFLYSGDFNRKIINFGAMLIHSSAIYLDGSAYLFSADSGVGKSTHTRLWLKAFGDRVHIFNDDKPVVRIYENEVIACSTPFDGGSGIALNESAPLKAVVFVERGEKNSVRIPELKEIIQKLYFQTAHMVDAKTAAEMLTNFEMLIKSGVKFYTLTCNMDIEAAHVAYNAIVR